MKVQEYLFLLGCALAPAAGFFPFEIHYGLMKGIRFLGGIEQATGASLRSPDLSHLLLEFLENWLSTLTAILFALGVFLLRSSVGKVREPKLFGLFLIIYFLGGVSFFLIPHIVPFLFAVVMLAFLANTRVAWVTGREVPSSESNPSP